MLAGDYNVVPTDLDIYPTKSWDRDALLQPQSRAAYQGLLAQGWTDAVRALHPKEPMYTFWDYMRKRWERDGGHTSTRSAQSRFERASAKRRRRSPHARTRGGQRPCTRVGGASRCARPADICEPWWRPRGDDADESFTENSEISRWIGGEVRGQTRAVGKPELSRRPLLVIDGDSFAHRSYHALPKTIRRSDGKGAGAIVGFANFLLRFYADERPRAVIVGWDSLDAPMKRHECFPPIRAGGSSMRN